MSDLEKIFHDHTGNIIHKWDHYFDIYERHFSRFRNKKVVIVEIGVFKGGSLEMWQQYFGKDCQIIGIDINPLCKKFESENIKIFIGGQEDREFLQQIKKAVPRPDIIIDDGSHIMTHIRATFLELYDWLGENGVYLVEDLHTSYWFDYEGGHRRRNTFIEYSKGLMDKLNAWHSRQRSLKVTDFSRTTHSLHFYDSVVVFEKRRIAPPTHSYAGRIESEEINDEPPRIEGWFKRFKNKIYKHTGIDL